MRKFIVYTLSAILATTTIVAGIITKMLSREEEKPTKLHEKIFKRFKNSSTGRTKRVTEKKEVKKAKPVAAKAVKKAKPMAKRTKVK